MTCSCFKPLNQRRTLLSYTHRTRHPELYAWSALAGPNAIGTAISSSESAAAKLRQAACLRLNGAQRVMRHGPQYTEEVIRLLQDASVLYDRAFMCLTGCPARSMLPHYPEDDPGAVGEGVFGLSALWNHDFAPIIREGVRCAERWLDSGVSPLWWALCQERERHRPGASQDAFEAGFLLRLQQTLALLRGSVAGKTSCDRT